MHCSVALETGMEKGAGKGIGREIVIGEKIVAIEIWMWTAKETEETGIEIGIGTGTVSVTAAMIGKGERLVMF